ncbi:hypothetical protein BBO99_00008422, partial [Phytophthora kernoviae]
NSVIGGGAGGMGSFGGSMGGVGGSMGGGDFGGSVGGSETPGVGSTSSVQESSSVEGEAEVSCSVRK